MARKGRSGKGPVLPENPPPDPEQPGTGLPDRGHHPGEQPGGEPGTGLPGSTPAVPEEGHSPAEAVPVPDPGTTPGEAASSGPQVTEVIEDPVEILVGMAERGEIDPWNINIIEVTDRFLSELKRLQQLNLHVSGRTLFFASTLLRMKSEQLEVVEAAEDEGDGEDLFGDEFGSGTGEEIDFPGRLGPIERLENEIQRRLDRKSMRKSPITLFELITELKNIEKEERRRRRMSDGHTDLIDSLIDADDVVSIAHEEGFQETSLTRLAEYLEGLEIDEEMTLAELCKKMEWGIPEVYIPLLFLALDGRCNLRQEEFFGDIFVQICRAEEKESPTPANG